MAVRRHLGRAVPIADVWTIVVALTWADADDIVLSINGKDLVIIIGTDVATTDVALGIAEMVNGSTQTGAGYAVNTTGDRVGEWSLITATVSGSTVTLTHNIPGRPVTMTVTETTAGNGTSVETHTTSATGPNHADNEDNWTADDTPDDGDDMVMDEGDVGIWYGLTFAAAMASITITKGYTGTIGLPRTNRDNPALPFDEYLGQYLTFSDQASQSTTLVTIGEGDGSGSGRIKLDLGDCDVQIIDIVDSGPRAEDAVPSVLLQGTDTATILNVQRGDVGVAFFEGESGHLAQLNVGFIEDQDDDSTVVIGNDCDLANAAIVITGGESSIASATGSGTIVLHGGTLSVHGATAHASIISDEGTVFYQSSGTLTTAIFGPGSALDMRRDDSSRTVTNMTLHAGAAVYDPFDTVTWTNGIDHVRCAPEDLVAFDVPKNKTWTPTSI